MACAVVGATVTGCAGGGSTEEVSAARMLDDANDAMGRLRSVTIDGDTTATGGGGYSSHLTTDLKSRCAAKTTWAKGGSLDQVRIDDVDYVRPDRAYVGKWSSRGTAGTKGRAPWVKAAVSDAEPGDGLVGCTWEFASFSAASKGEPTEVNGTAAIPLRVTDETDKGGSYTFYVATVGTPYILKVVYKGAKYRSTTSFSAFDKPLDVRAPAQADVWEERG